ncbi:MAG: hypothetical protein Q9183_003401 [Haloplaca sp. 2 TL-2023]
MINHTFLSERYDVVDTFGPPDKVKHLDPHDFSIIDNGTKMLQLTLIAHPTDEHDRVPSTVEEGVLEVLDISTGTVDFEWRSLDHVPRNHSCVGDSLADIFHANSVDQDTHGNFVLSSFHTCTIYSISSTTGSILWRLGGAFSDFTFLPYDDHDDEPFTLKHVHDVRSHPLSIALENPLLSQPLKRKIKNAPHTYLVLSLFDNAFGAVGPPTSSSSSALIILLDLQAMTAQILERYTHPRGEYAAMFGSVQLLPNGHRFVGWGSTRQVSEYDSQGHLVYHAEMGDEAQLIGSLRVYKSDLWKGVPANRGPDVYSYRWACEWERGYVYVSWNGAVGVEKWRVLGSGRSEGPWRVLDDGWEKKGFETRIMLRGKGFVRFVYVEALGERGEVMGRSEVVKTMVPPRVSGRACSEWRCPKTLGMEDASDSCGDYDGDVDLVVQE